MANVSIKFNGKEFLLSCDDGQEEHLEEFSGHEFYKKIEFETEYNRDFFDRILAYIIVDGENVSKIMVLNCLGVVYDNNNKKDWCE